MEQEAQETQKPSGRSNFGLAGIALGSISLLVAILHFWIGPIAPPPKTSTIKSIAKGLVNTIRGKEDLPAQRPWKLDKFVDIGTVTAGGITIILALISFVNHEPKRMTMAAALLGVGTIALKLIFVSFVAALIIFFFLYFLNKFDFT